MRTLNFFVIRLPPTGKNAGVMVNRLPALRRLLLA
jgi:hypothetical protein